MMTFALGLDLGFGFGLVVGFEIRFEIGLVVWGCGPGGCGGRLGAEIDADAAVVDFGTDRAREGCGKLGRDGGGERRFCKG
jgi:hypothetical protein